MKRVQVGTLGETEVVPILHEYHPVFRTADPVELRRINIAVRGQIRYWAQFLCQAEVLYGAELAIELDRDKIAVILESIRT